MKKEAFRPLGASYNKTVSKNRWLAIQYDKMESATRFNREIVWK